MKTKGTPVGVAVVALLALLLIGGSAGARAPAGPSGPGGPGVTSAVPPLLQYQGRLTDPGTGEPVEDGAYTMTFRLYDVESSGTPLWTETKDVAVDGGVFSTALGDTTALDPGLFNGQSLWLGTKVGADAEATPRQLILPMAYAVSLVPGAVVSTTSSSPAFTLVNSGAGSGLEVQGTTTLNGDLSVSGSLIGGSHEHSGNDITSGTVAEPRIDSEIARDGEVEGAITTHAGDPDAHHPRYTDAEAWGAVLANDGAGSTLDADSLDGQSSGSFATSGHDHWGSSWNGSGTGLTLYSTNDYAIHAESDATSGGDAAVYGVIGEPVGGYPSQPVAVRGDTTSGFGVAGRSSTSIGVYGYSQTAEGGFFTTGGTDPAGYGYNTGSGPGLEGYSISGHGVVGDGGSGSGDYGGHFTGQGGAYAYGSGDTGVLGVSGSTSGHGVRGESGSAYGELGRRSLVYFPPSLWLSYSYGVYGVGEGSSFNYGGYFSGETYGVSASGDLYGVYGSTTDASNDYGLYTPDNAYIAGKLDLVGAVDPVIGERFEVHPEGEYAVGDLLVIDPDSPYLILSTEPNDTKVIGVVGPTVDIKDGELMVIVLGYHGAKPDDSPPPMGPEEAGGADEVPTRTVARIKADAGYGAIKRGDLLTTSPNPGHAMRAEPVDVGGVEIYRPGTIIGKALQSLDSGQGLIEVFVALQ